ncbi:hypothetical protein [Nonomuraea jabiensis]|uniref:Uncharacterized protein n=1 Tax=Nonomuraea jabiensis TaxID=882448 RepID=A0A7W9LIF9_9ACTN|nr:hypothetical protein [Nonomuraea jabiensis]MBB5785036.1 hypothetical protein [Nonomuraea jabiensis]
MRRLHGPGSSSFARRICSASRAARRFGEGLGDEFGDVFDRFHPGPHRAVPVGDDGDQVRVPAAVTYPVDAVPASVARPGQASRS